MKKIIFTFLLSVVLILCGCVGENGVSPEETPTPSIVPMSESVEIPEGSVSFTVINSSGGDIYEMYISPASEEDYSEDILDDRIIKTNDKMKVYFMPSEGVEYYDLKVLREDGEYYTWLNVPAGTFEQIDITIGDEGPEFTVN